MKQLFHPEELIGKTIEKTIIDLDEREDWWIKFTDNSFVRLGVRNLARVSYEHHEAIYINDDKGVNSDDELLELGLVTSDEHRIANEIKVEERDKRHKEEQRIRKEEIDAFDREQYERLKKKFEGK